VFAAVGMDPLLILELLNWNIPVPRVFIQFLNMGLWARYHKSLKKYTIHNICLNNLVFSDCREPTFLQQYAKVKGIEF